jgi:transposase
VAKTHAPYLPAFRAEAVALARTSGKGVPQLAHDLGISEQALRGWMKRADTDAGRGAPGDPATRARKSAIQSITRWPCPGRLRHPR